VLSSCPVEVPKRLRWLKSGRFLRLLSALVAMALLSGILYNAIMIDRIPPTYSIGLSSTDGSGLALTLTSIDVDFSEQVKPDTAEKALTVTERVPGNPIVAGTPHWQGTKLIYTPSDKLPVATKFHVHVAAGVQDLAGNVQNGTGDLDFTTVGGPMITSAAPADGATGVPVDMPIQITFDRLMDTQKVVAGLTLEPTTPFQASWNGAVLTLTPTQPFQYGTTYTVSIGDPAVDTDGTKLLPYSTTFSTVGIGLRITSLIPAPNTPGVSIHTQIAVIFDADIDPASVSNAIKITPSVSGSTQAVSLSQRVPTGGPGASPPSSGPDELVFTPDNPLTPNTTYFVTLGSTVKRADGQIAPGRTWTFITGEPAGNALNQIAFISHRSGVDNVWLMNSDGSNQREITAELTPVNGYDISGDGTLIAYSTAGVVKKMSLNGDNLTTITPTGDFEYAPTITPDGTGLIVGRRDATGADLGYWRYPLVSGADVKQIATDGAPSPVGVAQDPDGITGRLGTPAWASRIAFSGDGSTMLVVRGSDNMVELVDTTGATKPVELSLEGNSRPVWVQGDGAFFLAGSSDGGSTWGLWRISTSGAMSLAGKATSDVTTPGHGLALIELAPDGAYHLASAASVAAAPTLLTNDAAWDEAAPSFSPDGTALVFGRVVAESPTASGGIWTINADGTGLTNLSTDGAWPRWIP
jgi:Bacterial Ig-like domain/WD40-like Beta Propeller Repeat